MSQMSAADWSSSPWETISDILRSREISEDEFVEIMGEQPGFVEALQRGERTIDQPLAEQLSEQLGSSVAFWLRRQGEFGGRSGVSSSVSFEAVSDWLRELPIKDMTKAGWISSQPTKQNKIAEALAFFGVTKFSEWGERYNSAMNSVAFRKSGAFSENTLSTIVWLRQGERLASQVPTSKWDSEILRSSMDSIRALTRVSSPEAFLPKLRSICAAAGVAVVVVKTPSGCRASGAARFMEDGRAVIQLSFRYLSDDHFWFTFFHEAAHLILHSENHLFLENNSGLMQSEEDQANDFAQRALIPETFETSFMSLPPNRRSVIKFAFEIGTSPGIVVGQMQHRRLIAINRLNYLKRRYSWEGIRAADVA